MTTEEVLALRLMGTEDELADVRHRIQLLREAITNEGRVPSYHRAVMAEHRAEWPTLWAAIDLLLDDDELHDE